MAFSLQGFGAGFASKMSQRLDEDRIRQEKLQDEARQQATRVRLAKQAEREKEKKVAEELTGSLSVYFSPEEVDAIMQRGVGAAKEALVLGQGAAAKGMSASPLINLPSSTLSTEESTEFATEVINKKEDLPTITTSAMDLEKTGTETPPTQKTGLFNLDYYGSIMAPADEEQASLDSAYAIAVQKSITGKTKEIRDKYTNLAEQYLEKIKEKDAAVKGEGNESSPFSKESISTIEKQARKFALEENNFTVDIEGRIQQQIGDMIPEYNLAMIQAANQMRIKTTGKDGLPMSYQANELQKDYVRNAISKIKSYAKNTVANPTETSIERLKHESQPIPVNQMYENAEAGQYRIGDIILVTETVDGVPVTRIKIYTNMAISSEYNNFIDAGVIING
jgi:hypothetical protein